LQLDIIQSVSITFAITAILRFYGNLKSHMQEHKPLAKLLAFKMVVGLVFLEKVRRTLGSTPATG
jgi:hypothetical protein